jgi:beta-lactamase regulating signal transducer with metallopeptidase domain
MTAATFLIDVVAKGALILAAAAALAPALRAASAATRHMVWTLALVSVAALPVLKLALPSWAPPGSGALAVAALRPSPPEAPVQRQAVRPQGAVRAEVAATDVRDGGPASGTVATPAARNDEPATGPVRPAEEAAAGATPHGDATAPDALRPGPSGGERPEGGSTSLWALFGAVRAAGCLVLLGRAAAGVLAVRRIARASARMETGPLAAVAAGLAREAGIRAPRLLIADDEVMPMAWGVLRPAIALPPSALAWPARRLDAVLRHEIAHLRRRDPLTQWIGELVRAVHWFNPLAWHAAGKLRDERELACDDEVLSRTTRASDYAAQLMDVARALRATAPAPALPMARPSQLASRIQAALDRRRNRAPLRRTRVLAGGLLSALLVSPLAAATPAASAGATDEAPSMRAGETDVAPSPAEEGSSAQTRPGAGPTSLDVAPAGLLPLADSPSFGATSACWEGDWKGSRTHNVNDESHRVKWESGRCSLDLRVEGEVRFTAALDGIEYMGPGSRFSLREDEGDTRRELEALPGSGGAPIYTYRVRGNEAPFEGDARLWFAGIVLQLARNSGFGAEQRVANLLRDGGVDAVLGEIELLGGDWVRSLYFRALIERTELASADVVRALGLAASTIDSDHYLAEVAGELADAGPLSDAARDALIGTVESLESDHYRAEVIGRALESGALGPRGLQTLLNAVARVDSDHYAAEILVEAARTQQFGSADRDAYIRVARTMDSDHYRSEVLNALLETGGEGVAEAVVLALPDAMDSGHYIAEVVTRLVAGGLRGSEAQRAFVQVIAGTDSDNYRAEMLQALLEGSGNDPEQVATVLVAARVIESDHYLAEVLDAVARRVPLEGALLDAFRETMNGLESETYYGRVSRSLNR